MHCFFWHNCYKLKLICGSLFVKRYKGGPPPPPNENSQMANPPKILSVEEGSETSFSRYLCWPSVAMSVLSAVINKCPSLKGTLDAPSQRTQSHVIISLSAALKGEITRACWSWCAPRDHWTTQRSVGTRWKRWAFIYYFTLFLPYWGWST